MLQYVQLYLRLSLVHILLFRLESQKEEEAIRIKNRIAGNLALFNLTKMLSILLDYQSQFIKPMLGKELAFIEMPPTLHLLEEDVRLDIDSFAFLLDSNDANLLVELSDEKSKFKKAIDAINERSQLHISEFQPILEQSGFEEGKNISLPELKKRLGPQLYAAMQQSTEQIISHVSLTISGMLETSKKN